MEKNKDRLDAVKQAGAAQRLESLACKAKVFEDKRTRRRRTRQARKAQALRDWA